MNDQLNRAIGQLEAACHVVSDAEELDIELIQMLVSAACAVVNTRNQINTQDLGVRGAIEQDLEG